MRVIIATIKANLFCIRHVLRGYLVQKWWLGFHGPCVRIEVVNGESVVKVFYSRPDYTPEEQAELESCLAEIKAQIKEEDEAKANCRPLTK